MYKHMYFHVSVSWDGSFFCGNEEFRKFGNGTVLCIP